MELSNAIEQYQDENDLYRLEGRKGTENLAKIVHAIGYNGFQRYGQLQGGASLSDIFEFLDDNPGAIEALLDWIKDRHHQPQWVQAIIPHLQESPPAADEYPNGACPDCGEEIDLEAKVGEACENCGHVFVFEQSTDDGSGTDVDKAD